MTNNSRIITLQDLSSEEQVLRIRLTQAAEDLRHRRPIDRGWLERTTAWMNRMFSRDGLNIDLEEGIDAATTERNKERVRRSFERMRNELDTQQENVLSAMEGMTSEQQEGVVMFWEEAYKFLMNVIGWIKDVFNKILDKIKQGFHLVKEVVTGFFSQVIALIRSVF